jgi:RNA polymerase sigma-70 factor, ECF subfamily
MNSAPQHPHLEAFEAERDRLFGIAYRMLGSVREAEDVVQDAWIRWDRADRAKVESPAGYLVQTVTRLSMDVLRSARSRRMEYVGPWLPEPLIQDADDPRQMHALADDLSQAFLLMLERLSPAERAVFLLRNSFGFSYREVAEIVGKTEENCRQIERRARGRLDGVAVRPADPAEHERLLYSFLRATREGDLDGLVALLTDDAVALGDGGGVVSAARKPVHGALNVARFFLGLASKAPADAELRPALINGGPGVMVLVGGRLYSTMTFEIREGRISKLLSVLNPAKLPGGSEPWPDRPFSPAYRRSVAQD